MGGRSSLELLHFVALLSRAKIVLGRDVHVRGIRTQFCDHQQSFPHWLSRFQVDAARTGDRSHHRQMFGVENVTRQFSRFSTLTARHPFFVEESSIAGRCGL